jgi:hypothetical protein
VTYLSSKRVDIEIGTRLGLKGLGNCKFIHCGVYWHVIVGSRHIRPIVFRAHWDGKRNNSAKSAIAQKRRTNTASFPADEKRPNAAQFAKVGDS